MNKLFLSKYLLLLGLLFPIDFNTAQAQIRDSAAKIASFEVLSREESPIGSKPEGWVHPLLDSQGHIVAYYLDDGGEKVKFSFLDGKYLELDNRYQLWRISENGERIINYGPSRFGEESIFEPVIYSKNGERIKHLTTDLHDPVYMGMFTTFAMNHDGSFWFIGYRRNEENKNDIF